MSTMTLDVSDLAYTAGIMDGEGSFVLGVWRKDNTSDVFVHQVKVCQKKVAVCHWLKERFNGSVSTDKRDGMGRWTLSGQEAIVHFINQLLPYLKIKHREARMMRFACKLKPYFKKPLVRACKEVLLKELQCEKRRISSPFVA